MATALAMSELTDASFIQENLAVALDYGYYKGMRKEFSEAGSVVLFCDMG